MTEEAARFRIEFEARTGEKLVELAMANMVSLERDAAPGDRAKGRAKGSSERSYDGAASSLAMAFGGDAEWGLLVLTEASLRFQRPPSRHWLSSLLGRREESDSQGPELIIPLAGETRLDLPRKSRLARIFGSGYQELLVEWKAEGREAKAAFRLDPRASMVAALGALAAQGMMPQAGTAATRDDSTN